MFYFNLCWYNQFDKFVMFYFFLAGKTSLTGFILFLDHSSSLKYCAIFLTLFDISEPFSLKLCKLFSINYLVNGFILYALE